MNSSEAPVAIVLPPRLRVSSNLPNPSNNAVANHLLPGVFVEGDGRVAVVAQDIAQLEEWPVAHDIRRVSAETVLVSTFLGNIGLLIETALWHVFAETGVLPEELFYYNHHGVPSVRREVFHLIMSAPLELRGNLLRRPDGSQFGPQFIRVAFDVGSTELGSTTFLGWFKAEVYGFLEIEPRKHLEAAAIAISIITGANSLYKDGIERRSELCPIIQLDAGPIPSCLNPKDANINGVAALNLAATEPGKTRATRALQEQLALTGADPGRIDGDYGPDTEAAVSQFAQAAGVPTNHRNPAFRVALANSAANASGISQREAKKFKSFFDF